jgi:Transposase DNA-binding/Transposase Tn5 dimerisation domain
VRGNEADWAMNEFGGAALGDQRRTDRLAAAASVLAEHPRESLPEACEDAAMLKGVYRLLENAAVRPEAMLASHVLATLGRVGGAPLVLAVQDTTDLDYSAHRATTGLGAIGNGFGRGLLLHTTLALTPDGVPLGLLAQESWTRDPAETGKKLQRKPLPVSAKESGKWRRGLAALHALAPRCPRTQFLSVADREADVYDLFCAERAANVALLVRASYDRQVGEAADGSGRLRATLRQQPGGAALPVEVPRRPGQPARTATVGLRWATLTLQPPAKRTADHREPVTMGVVWAHEESPPAELEALNWLLLTTLPVPDQAAAEQCLAYYACRFLIERWHKTLKSGCALEARQLASREALQRGLALYSVIAWKVLAAALLARTSPDLPCTVLLEAPEWQALYCRIHQTTQLPATPPSLSQVVRWVAKRGGFLGRTGDGEPGPTVLWRGFQHLTDLTAMFQLFTTSNSPALGS